MSALERVLSRPEFRERPPLLLDVGASGGLPAAWRAIAPYSVCLAFDPDSREMGYAERASPYKKLIVVPKALVAGKGGSASFYLTRSPYCSSLLKPLKRRLEDWDFAGLFEVVGKKRLPTAGLAGVLKALKLGPVDWFKCDTQGTDLRLFAGLPRAQQRRALVAEFEPGILDAYQGEDKLWKVMRHMEALPFWAERMEVRGPRRARAGSLPRLQAEALPAAAGWAEIHYMNDFSSPALGLRELLLGWVFATLKGQHGFAFELARRGQERFGDPAFGGLGAASRRSIRLHFLRRLPAMAAAKLKNRILR